MEAFLTPQYLIIFGAGILIFGIWFFLHRRKTKNQKPAILKDGEVVYKPIDARVFDRTTIPFRTYNETIPPASVKAIIESKHLSRQLIFMGKKVFPFFKVRDAQNNIVYEAVTEPLNVKHSPITLHNEMQHPYVPILDDVSIDKSFMQKYGHLLLWAGIIAFLIVMVVSNK
ncbi:hypothetical protein M0R72_21655 [Candidatus Pacearchaeota archaeon]|jgi:hypothetical protein|nr:hypothetical protein [Candidatus Pacearchaeota archaeon]